MTHPPRPGSPFAEHLCCTSLISNCQSTCCLQILEQQANLSVNGHLSQRMLPCDEIVTWPGCTLYIVQPRSDENTTALLERLGFGQQRESLEARLDSSVCQILNHWQKLLEDFLFPFLYCGFRKWGQRANICTNSTQLEWGAKQNEFCSFECTKVCGSLFPEGSWDRKWMDEWMEYWATKWWLWEPHILLWAAALETVLL